MLIQTMKIKEAKAIIGGGLSKPSKMPGRAWNISAKLCKTGSKLRKIKGSVCSKCYALKGRYVFPKIIAAMKRRLDAMQDPRWVTAMQVLINKQSSGWFRFLDSGDLQDVPHLEKFVAIAKGLPLTNFWIPTKEIGIVSEYHRRHGSFPDNVTVRLSGFMIDGPAPIALAKRLGLVVSSVVSDGSFTCPASKQGGKCLDCRACWNKDVMEIKYPAH